MKIINKPRKGALERREMRSNFKVGKVIAGFAYTVSKDPDSPHSRMLLDTFAKTQEKATAKLVNSKKYFFSEGNGVYRLYSVHMTVMRELEFNLDEGLVGIPSLDDDDEEHQPLKRLNGRIVLEDPFDLPNPLTTRRRNK